jgi:hypothetical protein
MLQRYDLVEERRDEWRERMKRFALPAAEKRTAPPR